MTFGELFDICKTSIRPLEIATAELVPKEHMHEYIFYYDFDLKISADVPVAQCSSSQKWIRVPDLEHQKDHATEIALYVNMVSEDGYDPRFSDLVANPPIRVPRVDKRDNEYWFRSRFSINVQQEQTCFGFGMFRESIPPEHWDAIIEYVFENPQMPEIENDDLLPVYDLHSMLNL